MIAGVQRSADETLIEYGVREGAAVSLKGQARAGSQRSAA